MALMFQRLARNFAKHGYFPTDEQTMEGIVSRLGFDNESNKEKTGVVRMIDPCCGEGTALAECQHHIKLSIVTSHKIDTLGIEIDEERAYHAKSLSNLNTVAHANFNDCVIPARQVGFLFLNPPYGYITADKARLSDNSSSERLETIFYKDTYKLLQFKGVMVFIIPHYSLDELLSKMIASHFNKVSVYKAAEDRFKQVVIFGIRQKAQKPDMKVVEKLQACRIDINSVDVLRPINSFDGTYKIPLSQSVLKFTQITMDEKQLSAEIIKKRSLWNIFEPHFAKINKSKYRPLTKMTDWHLALALAAGQASGLVKSKDGKKTLLVKGNTFKDKKVTFTRNVNTNTGAVSETRIATDIFVPVIKGINLTEDSSDFGNIVIIR